MQTINTWFWKATLATVALATFLGGEAVGQSVVNIPDPTLEAAVRSIVGNTNDPLTTADLLGVTNLASYYAVTNLSGLEYATNLQSLALYAGNPASLLALTGLPNLCSLSVEGGAASNYTGLAALTRLTNLDLYLSSVTNVSWLAGLTNLVSLDLSWNQLTDPGPLAGLAQLKRLDLSGNPLGDCAALAGLTNLSGSLYLDMVSITNAGVLTELQQVSELTLYQNHVADLAPLSNLTQLAALDMGCNPIRDFSPLAGLTNLQRLYLNGTTLTNLDRLPLLPRVAELDINYNRLDNLNALTGFTNLAWVNASYNCLTNIDGLTNLARLAKVYLQVNLLDTNAASSAMTDIEALTGRGVVVGYNPQNVAPAISIPEHLVVPANEISSVWITAADDLTPGDRLTSAVGCSDPALVTVATSSKALSPVSGFAPVIIPGPGISLMTPPNPPSIPAWQGYLNITAASNQAGTATITLTVTDDTGLSNTAMLALEVISPVAFDPASVGSTGSNVSWRTFGSNPWQGQTNVTHSGGWAAQSGSEESWLEASVAGPGMLSYWWRYVSTNGGGGGGQLRASCAESGLLAGSTMWPTPNLSPGTSEPPAAEWKQSVLSIPKGHWALRWQVMPGWWSQSPMLWLADVQFTPGEALCWLETGSTQVTGGYFPLTAHGPPGELYDLETSPDLRQWSRARRFTFSNFEESFYNLNGASGAQFYRLHKASLMPIWLEKPAFDPAGAVRLTLHSEPGQLVALEWSSDLVTWTTLVQTNNLEGALQVTEHPTGEVGARFYRAKGLAPANPPLGRPGMISPGIRYPRRRHGSYLPQPSPPPPPGIVFPTT
jgi:internalin A